jgi:hypothetical protein
MSDAVGNPSNNVETFVSVLRGYRASVAPGTVAGTVIYLQTGRLWQALVLACLVGPPTRAIQKVVAEWIDLLRPPSSWRRPRRRGS